MNMILYEMLGNAADSQGKKSALECQLRRKTHGGIQLMVDERNERRGEPEVSFQAVGPGRSG
jgi:hypothetical protein